MLGVLSAATHVTPGRRFASSLGWDQSGTPAGKSNSPWSRLSRDAMQASVAMTSAYLACISHRLMACEACERSKQPSSARVMRSCSLKASSTEARTQPLVVVPPMSRESAWKRMSNDCSGVPWNALGFHCLITMSCGSGATSWLIVLPSTRLGVRLWRGCPTLVRLFFHAHEPRSQPSARPPPVL
jgi:hypothetical protein